MSVDKIVFSLIGEGAPLLRAVRKIGAIPNMVVNSVFSDTLSPKALQNAAGRDILLLPAKQINQLASRSLLAEDDWLLSINNFNYLVPSAILEIFKARAVNVHLGLLPEYAGRHAYQWAIRNGEEKTGATLHIMEKNFDSGGVISERIELIKETDTGLSVFKRCLSAGVRLVDALIDDLAEGKEIVSRPQLQSHRTAYKSIDAGNGRIDWSAGSMDIFNFIRAADFKPFDIPSYTPWFQTQAGERYQLLRAKPADKVYTGASPGQIFVGVDGSKLVACGGASSLLPVICKRYDAVLEFDQIRTGEILL